MPDFDIDIFLRSKVLKPALSPRKANLLFVISAYYLIFWILPFIFATIIKITSLYDIIHFETIFIIFRTFIFLSIYIVCYIFFSSYYKTSAKLEKNYFEKEFYLNLSKKMIKNKNIFFLYILIQLSIIFIVIFLVSYKGLDLHFFVNNSNISVDKVDRFSFWFDKFKFVDIFDKYNDIFLFEYIQIYLLSVIFYIIPELTSKNNFFSCILRPLRFYIWERKI
jgi:hypothetical protein